MLHKRNSLLTRKRIALFLSGLILLVLIGLSIYLWYFKTANTTYAETELYSNIEIIERVRTVNLTEWLPDSNPNDDNHSDKAIYDDEFNLRRIREDVTMFAVPYATTGMVDPNLTSRTHSVQLVRAFHKRPGWPQVSEYNAILDISKEPIDKAFNAHLRSVRYGGFADPKSNWAATSVLHPIRKLTITVKFPKDKPAQKLRYRIAFFFKGSNFSEPDSVPEVTLPAQEVTWVIDHPLLGYAYKIEWDW